MSVIRTTMFTAAALAALLMMVGCRHAARPEISAAPAPNELPSRADEQPPPSAMLIGVEGQTRPVVTLPVPAFEPVEPTPAEREILGPEPTEPELDVLVFWRPPRGPEQGVMPSYFRILAGRCMDVGGAEVGREAARRSYSNAGSAGHHAEAYPVKREVAKAGDPRPVAGKAAGGWSVDVSEGPKRQGARHADRYDR